MKQYLSWTQGRRDQGGVESLCLYVARFDPSAGTDGVDFVCPFCQAKCTTSLEHCAVLHTEPMCEKFEQLGPVEFLKAVNERMAN